MDESRFGIMEFIAPVREAPINFMTFLITVNPDSTDRVWGGDGGHPFGTGAWRAPANNTNTFARESHIDTLAARAGVDPLEFRLNNLKDERMIRCTQSGRRNNSVGNRPKAPSRRGFGISLGIDSGTYVAHIAEVAVDQNTGAVDVKRVVCAQDMGFQSVHTAPNCRLRVVS